MRSPARGNVFALLFGAVALTGVLAAVGMQTLTGPVTTITRVTQKNIAETNLLTNAKIIANSVPLNTFTDGDTVKEAAQFVPAGGGETAPTGGGFVPTDLGLALTDPWGSKYGYCVWNHGSDNGTTAHYAAGDNTTSASISRQPMFAIISAGPDKEFQTACPTITPGNATDVKKAAGSDDLVQAFTYEEARGSANGLWSLNAGDEDIAELKAADDTTVNVSINRDTGTGDFLGVTTDTLAAKTDNVTIDGGLKLDVLGSETCDAANAGVIRFNTASKTLVICDGVSEWKPAGSDIWERTAAGVFLKTLTDKVGIGNNTPSVALDVTGDTKTSGNIEVGGTGAVTGNFTVGTDALSVDATNKFLGIGKATPSVALDVVGDTMLAGDAAITDNLTVDTDILVVDATNDKIGMGTAAPEHQLDIIGTTTIGPVGTLDENNAIVRIQENTSGPNLYMDGNTIISDASLVMGSIGNAGVQLLSNSSLAFSLDNTGNAQAYYNMGVSGTLNVGGATSLASTLTVADDAAFDTDTLFVDVSADAVGIGTTSPQAKLDVDGGIKLGLHQAGTSCTPDGVIQYNGSRMEICVGGLWQGVSSIDKLDDIGDVNVPDGSVNDGQVLAWDDTAGQWVAKNIIDLGPAAVNPAGEDGSVQFKTGSDLDADKDYFHWDKAQHRLGVGNNAPGYTLDVTGIANVSTDLQVGQDLFVTRHTAITGNLTVDATTFFVSATNNNVGIGTNNPHSSALIDMTSTTGGLLPPRMNATQRNAIGSPATGLMLFNTTNNKLQIWDGLNWLNVGVASGLGTSMIEGWPDALNCGEANYPSIYYLTYAPLQADGKYHYRNILDSANYSFIFNADKTYSSKTGTSETGCQNKSINALYAEGRAFNFVGGSQAGEGGSMVTDVPDALDCGISGTQRFLFLQTATASGYTYAFSGGANGIGMQVTFNALPAGTYSTTTNTAGWANATGCDGKTLTQLASEDRAFYLVGGTASGGGSNAAAGGGGYIQFNTAGVLDADSALTFNTAIDRLVLAGGVQIGTDATCAAGGADNGTVHFSTNKFEFCLNGSWIDMAKSGVPNETDPQVGSLTSSKWCTTDGTVINCTTNAPILVESDPKVGTLNSGKWCTASGSTITCTSDAPGIADGDKGDVTVSSSGGSFTIDSGAVSYAKIQDVNNGKLLGRYGSGAGVVQEITIGTGLSLNSGTGELTASGSVAGTDTQVQFNDAGAMAGAAAMLWDKVANRLTVGATTVSAVAGVVADFVGKISTNSVIVKGVSGAAAAVDSGGGGNGFTAMTSAARVAITTPTEGTMIYNTTDHRPEYFNGTNWIAFGAGNIVGGNGAASGTPGVSCKQILADGYSTGSGVYWLDIDGIGVGGAPIQAYCDMTTNGGGWTACGSFKNQARGTGSSAGLDYLNATWNTAGTAFLNASGTVQSYGNFCNSMSFTQLMGQSRSSTSTIQFTTAGVPVTGTPFAYGTNDRFTTTGGFIGIISRNTGAVTPGYFAGGSCTAASNANIQGSVLCVGDGTNFQMALGNINNTAVGDTMCGYNSTCGNSTTQIIVMFAK